MNATEINALVEDKEKLANTLDAIAVGLGREVSDTASQFARQAGTYIAMLSFALDEMTPEQRKRAFDTYIRLNAKHVENPKNYVLTLYGKPVS